jgi:hypothetical protein
MRAITDRSASPCSPKCVCQASTGAFRHLAGLRLRLLLLLRLRLRRRLRLAGEADRRLRRCVLLPRGRLGTGFGRCGIGDLRRA